MALQNVEANITLEADVSQIKEDLQDLVARVTALEG